MTDAPEKPAPDATGLYPISVEDYLLTYLYTMNAAATPGQIAGWNKTYVDKKAVENSLDGLAQRGLVEVEGNKLSLSKAGRTAAEKLAGGRFDKKKRDDLLLPALALGVPPSSKDAARLGRPDLLRATLLTTLYNLPLDRAAATMTQVVSAFVIRALAGKAGQARGDGRLKDLAEDLGDLSDPGRLRTALLRAALRLGQDEPLDPVQPGSAPTPPKPEPPNADRQDDDLAGFAQRVQALASAMTTPPLSDAVAIAQVYDAYGRQHADAGTLEVFKARLLTCQGKRLLDLRTLDRPEALERELRTRSEIQSRYRNFHLIGRKGVT